MTTALVFGIVHGRGDFDLNVTQYHRNLLDSLDFYDRRWVARTMMGSTSFPARRVSAVTVASLDEDQLRALRARVQARSEGVA